MSHKPDIDINADGFIDRNVVDGPVTVADLGASTAPRDLTLADVEQAFTWAKQRGALDHPLLLAFVDHALTGKLRLDPFNEVLTAEKLDALLDDYQQATGNPVIIFLEACHTGSLLDGIKGDQRIIISATDDKLAYYDNLGAYSFSKFYFDNLRRGEDWFSAFNQVTQRLPSYGHPFNRQLPQLDDDGDGLKTSRDGELAAKYCLNGCFGALSGEITLEALTPTTSLTVGESLNLSARAGITEGSVVKVWALVMTPESAAERNEQGFSLQETPLIEMQTQDDGLWSGAFSGFQTPGDYSITFMAQDDEGFISAANPLSLTMTDNEVEPRDDETTPIDDAVLPTGNALIPSHAVYQNGEMLRITFPALPADMEQYAAIQTPDMSLFLLSDLNQALFFTGQLVQWQGAEIAMAFPVTDFMARGVYSLILLRVPAGTEPLSQPALWNLGISQFTVK
ncbi:hypothetical protein [Candidatus Venteria ishoeyi]|uniref:Peptidase C13 family protein n=1 Tax=Candidatus Venteria ishoeyi TaxID=1899563 RepID=A0A1H6F6C7_9GAMM|nr:hypothetical protein [Candidatus Venteria ishoeyi]SEH05083.1 Uncharacterised protein [Candidatus Venteria ishoeyi]